MSEDRKPELFIGGVADGQRKMILHGSTAVVSEVRLPVQAGDADAAGVTFHTYRRERLALGDGRMINTWVHSDLSLGDAMARLVEGYGEPAPRPAKMMGTLTLAGLVAGLTTLCASRGVTPSRVQLPVWLIVDGVAHPCDDVWFEPNQFGGAAILIGIDPR